MKSFVSELNRRNVIRVTVAYLVTAWVVMQVLELATDTFGAPDWTLKLAFTVLALGLVPTIVFSWVYELTPEGLRRESEITPESSITAHTARKLDLAVVVLLLTAMALVIVDRMVLPKPSSAPVEPQAAPGQSAAGTSATRKNNSVAVLPFVDLSPGGDQEYFSDGIAEEILNVLVRVDNLSVASRTSSFQFKGRDLGIPQIAEALDVRHILEGSVRKAGETLRITAQLIDTANDRHLWSDTYDRALTAENVFDIQDEIASAIVQALSSALGIEASSPLRVEVATENLSAYDLYLQAKPLFQSRTRLLDAERMLARATELDPNFVQAMELRAGLYAVLAEYEPSRPASETNQTALDLVSQILSIKPDSAVAYAVRGNVLSYYALALEREPNWEQLIGDLERALELDPRQTEGHNWLGIALNALGFVEPALAHFNRCHTVEPFYRPCAENRLVTMAALGRDEEAMANYLADLDHGVSNPIWLPLGLLARRDEELLFKSITNSSQVLLGWPRHAEMYDAYREQRADPELARDALRFARQNGKLTELELALMFIPIGAYDLQPMPLYFWDASYADYRQSPQFRNFINSSGIAGYWRQHGYPPQCRAAGAENFECD